MLVFFDESGDTGFKIGSGSSALFTVTMVVFEEHDAANSLDARIELLRQELRKGPTYEFHFSKCSDPARTAFFRAVASHQFYFFSFVIDKSQLRPEHFSSQDAFYQYICGLIFEGAKPYLDNAIVKMDGRGSHDFRNQLASYLKRRLNDPDSQKEIHQKGSYTLLGSKQPHSVSGYDLWCRRTRAVGREKERQGIL